MSSGKETPRQKMIGMMYLVLTALLALNVSKDILDAFVVVNKGLENSNENFSYHNENLYAEFDLAKVVDPVRVTPNWKLAQEVKKNSLELTEFIDKLQKKIISQTEGIQQNIADTLQMENIDKKDSYDTPTNILIGDSEDGSAGASHELKSKLINYQTQLTNYVLPEDRKNVKIDLNAEDPEHSENNENWEMYNFFNRPVVASLTILSKIKSDVKNAESVIVDYLLKQADSEVMKFDTIAAKVIPQSNYVLLGEEYKSDIFIAAFSKTKKPEVMVGNYNEATKTFEGTPNSIEVQNGLGKYVASTTREGIVAYSGTIKLRSPKGKEILFPFKSEYIVAKPSLTVSADNMNVLYRGLENNISVSVPGIPNERLKVSATNVSLISKGNGKYIVKPNVDGKASINVFATMENGEERSMGTMTFRIKRVPTPVAKIGKITSSGMMTKNELMSTAGIISFYNLFDFEATCKVISFDVGYNANGGDASEHVEGNLFLPKVKNLFNSLKRNNRVYFENIKAIGPDGIVVDLAPISIKIN
jgi:gliding motility-associated protein GldM